MKYVLYALFAASLALILLALPGGRAPFNSGLELDSLNMRVLRAIINPGACTGRDMIEPEIIEPPAAAPHEICAGPEQLYDGRIFISVFNHVTGEIYYLELEDYLVGVVFAEMPASFELEALKAQAVAARSYAVYKMINVREHERAQHNGAVICTDFRHCKAHVSFEDARYYGDRLEYLWARVSYAVSATAGQILIYNARPAIAVFHAMSGGMTESAENVWGHAVPYLTGVPTKELANGYRLRNFETAASFSADEFREILAGGGLGAALPRNPRRWVERVGRTDTGRAAYAIIYGERVPGVRLRELFGLRSTDFELELSEGGYFTFTVRGHGHGVGMSQYGANLMALAGSGYAEILALYYQGTQIGGAAAFFAG